MQGTTRAGCELRASLRASPPRTSQWVHTLYSEHLSNLFCPEFSRYNRYLYLDFYYRYPFNRELNIDFVLPDPNEINHEMKKSTGGIQRQVFLALVFGGSRVACVQ